MDTPDLRYPVGKFKFPEVVNPEKRVQFVQEIQEAPARMRASTAGLSDAQLDTPYRPDGWTVRQLVHHVPDSHLNSYIRFRWALTEDEPTIKAYREDRWAELPDARTMPVEVSLALLESLHGRWVTLLRALTEEQRKRTFRSSSVGSSESGAERRAIRVAWAASCGARSGVAKQRRMAAKAGSML
jgi:hypothetical protein